MKADPIIAELRRFRDEFARRHKYSMAAICADLRGGVPKGVPKPARKSRPRRPRPTAPRR